MKELQKSSRGEGAMRPYEEPAFRRGGAMIAIPPGATLNEQIADRGMAQKELASHMEIPEKRIRRLMSGHARLTQDIAVRLERVLGISARYWLALEAIYRKKAHLISISRGGRR